jgi:protein phosphatase
MGTTLALVVVTRHVIKSYNIGDSRIYALRDDDGASSGNFSLISEDHTLAAQKVKIGVITEEQALSDRGRHRLTRYLGIFEDEMIVSPDIIEPLPAVQSRRVLLCSDGLTDMVADSRVGEILRLANTADEAVDLLLDEALKNGGTDNVTCVVVDAPRCSQG